MDPAKVASTRLLQSNLGRAKNATNLDFEATAAGDDISGWFGHGHDSDSSTRRISTEGPHGGRAFLEIKSTGRGFPLVYSAVEIFSAIPYRGKRARFRASLKAEGVVEEAYLSLEVRSKGSPIRGNTMGRGAKGRTDWQPREIVVDVPDHAEVIGLGIELRGAGTLGADDVSVEVVDPSRVAVTPESEMARAAREKRTRELVEAYPSLPERPENLDFER